MRNRFLSLTTSRLYLFFSFLHIRIRTFIYQVTRGRTGPTCRVSAIWHSGAQINRTFTLLHKKAYFCSFCLMFHIPFFFFLVFFCVFILVSFFFFSTQSTSHPTSFPLFLDSSWFLPTDHGPFCSPTYKWPLCEALLLIHPC